MVQHYTVLRTLAKNRRTPKNDVVGSATSDFPVCWKPSGSLWSSGLVPAYLHRILWLLTLCLIFPAIPSHVKSTSSPKIAMLFLTWLFFSFFEISSSPWCSSPPPAPHPFVPVLLNSYTGIISFLNWSIQLDGGHTHHIVSELYQLHVCLSPIRW